MTVGHTLANLNAASSLVDNDDGNGYVPQVCWPIDFLELKVGNNPITRLTNHFHDFTSLSDFESGTHSYLAVSSMLGFGNVAEGLEAKDENLTVSLSGVGQTNTALILSNPIEGSRVYLRRGFYNSKTGKLVDDPYLRWAGRVHSYSIADDYRFSAEDTIVISLTCRSLLLTLLRRATGRYTNQAGYEQYLRSYTTPLTEDKSMEFLASLTYYNPQFGKGLDEPKPQSGGGGGGGGKIVCTAMNTNYGFGSFRNAVWLNYAKENLTPYHEKGYHAIFRPWVDAMYKDTWYSPFLTKWGEGIARRRSADIFAVMKGRKKRSWLARIERAIMEPMCYLVGRFISK